MAPLAARRIPVENTSHTDQRGSRDNSIEKGKKKKKKNKYVDSYIDYDEGTMEGQEQHPLVQLLAKLEVQLSDLQIKYNRLEREKTLIDDKCYKLGTEMTAKTEALDALKFQKLQQEVNTSLLQDQVWDYEDKLHALVSEIQITRAQLAALVRPEVADQDGAEGTRQQDGDEGRTSGLPSVNPPVPLERTLQMEELRQALYKANRDNELLVQFIQEKDQVIQDLQQGQNDQNDRKGVDPVKELKRRNQTQSKTIQYLERQVQELTFKNQKLEQRLGKKSNADGLRKNSSNHGAGSRASARKSDTAPFNMLNLLVPDEEAARKEGNNNKTTNSKSDDEDYGFYGDESGSIDGEGGGSWSGRRSSNISVGSSISVASGEIQSELVHGAVQKKKKRQSSGAWHWMTGGLFEDEDKAALDAQFDADLNDVLRDSKDAAEQEKEATKKKNKQKNGREKVGIGY